MKRNMTILLLLLSIQVFGQLEPEKELEKIFYSLPIRLEIETIIDSAKNNDLITSFENSYHITDKPYFSGHISKNNYLSIKPISGQIEIFRSGIYTLRGVDLDSLDVVYVSFDFGEKMTKDLRKEYKRLVRNFKKLTGKSEKYKLYADPGLIGYGFCFFKSENDKLPFMSIEVGLGDCVSDTKSLIVNYYKIEN